MSSLKDIVDAEFEPPKSLFYRGRAVAQQQPSPSSSYHVTTNPSSPFPRVDDRYLPGYIPQPLTESSEPLPKFSSPSLDWLSSGSAAYSAKGSQNPAHLWNNPAKAELEFLPSIKEQENWTSLISKNDEIDRWKLHTDYTEEDPDHPRGGPPKDDSISALEDENNVLVLGDSEDLAGRPSRLTDGQIYYKTNVLDPNDVGLASLSRHWNDGPQYLNPTSASSQPITSNEAMMRFKRQADEVSTASRAATWGSRRGSEPSLSDLESNDDEDGAILMRARLSTKDPGSTKKLFSTEALNKCHEFDTTSNDSGATPSTGGVQSAGCPVERSKSMDYMGSSVKSEPFIKLEQDLASHPGKEPAQSSSFHDLAFNSNETSHASNPWPATFYDMFAPAVSSALIRDTTTKSDFARKPNTDQDKDDEDEDEDNEETEDMMALEETSLHEPIISTYEGFKAHIRRLNPYMDSRFNWLISRLAHQQEIRYKNLLELKIKHSTAVETGTCSSSKQQCLAMGGSATILDSRGSTVDTLKLLIHDSTSNVRADTETAGKLTNEIFPAGIPMPPTESLPAEFECQLCFKVKKFMKPSDWIKHVHEDCQPFTCTYDKCKESKSFKRKADWVRHENERHRHLEWWICQVDDCRHPCYRKDNFLQHLVREHKLPEPRAKTKAAIKKARLTEPAWIMLDRCHHETSNKPQDEPCKFCGRQLTTWKKLSVHLAKHMEHITMPILALAMAKEVDSKTIIAPVENHLQPNSPKTWAYPSSAPSVNFVPQQSDYPSPSYSPFVSVQGTSPYMHEPYALRPLGQQTYYPTVNPFSTYGAIAPVEQYAPQYQSMVKHSSFQSYEPPHYRQYGRMKLPHDGSYNAFSHSNPFPHSDLLTPESNYESPQHSMESDRPSISSRYWTAAEQEKFPTLLKQFGTDWHGIAQSMKTKTSTMVKIYYQRQVDTGKMKDWEQFTSEADAREERTEPLFVNPSLSVSKQTSKGTELLDIDSQDLQPKTTTTTLVASSRTYGTDTVTLIQKWVHEMLRSISDNGVSIHAALDIQWNLEEFLHDQYEQQPDIGTIITISGTAIHAFATTCMEYVQQNWPRIGAKVVDAVQRALNSQAKESSDNLEGFSLRIIFMGTNTSVKIHGSKQDIVEVTQILGWMAAALRTSSTEKPQYSELKLTRPYTRAIFEESYKEGWLMTFDIVPLEYNERSCWYPLFLDPVIAKGFPTPQRENNEEGLELSIELMAALGAARYAIEFDGGLILKGLNVMFVPTKSHKGSIQWHLIHNKTKSRLKYSEVRLQCPNRALLDEVDHESIQNTRAFLGWWSMSKTMLGTDNYDYKRTTYSSAMPSSRSSGGAVNFSKVQFGNQNFAIGKKDSKLYLSRAGPLQQVMQWAETMPVLLYDVEDKRSWFVRASDVILHTIRTRHAKKPFNLGGKDVRLVGSNPDLNADQAAEKAIMDMASVKLFQDDVYRGKDYYLSDLVCDIWALLESLAEMQDSQDNASDNDSQVMTQSKLQGWEFMALVDQKSPLRRKETNLEKSNGGWQSLIQEVNAVVLLAHGFGEIIQPSASAGLCPQWKALPKNQDYMAAGVPLLKRLCEEAGSTYPYLNLTPSKLRWHKKAMLFEKCSVRGSSPGDCDCERLQQVIPMAVADIFGEINPPGKLEDRGCVMFGKPGSLPRSTPQPAPTPTYYHYTAQQDDHSEDEDSTLPDVSGDTDSETQQYGRANSRSYSPRPAFASSSKDDSTAPTWATNSDYRCNGLYPNVRGSHPLITPPMSTSSSVDFAIRHINKEMENIHQEPKRAHKRYLDVQQESLRDSKRVYVGTMARPIAEKERVWELNRAEKVVPIVLETEHPEVATVLIIDKTSSPESVVCPESEIQVKSNLQG